MTNGAKTPLVPITQARMDTSSGAALKRSWSALPAQRASRNEKRTMNTFKRRVRMAFLAGIVLIAAMLPGALCVLFAPGVDERVAAAREAAALENYVVRMVDTGAIRLIANTSVAAPSRLFAHFPVPGFAVTAMPENANPARRAYGSTSAASAPETSDATFVERLRALPWTWLLAGVAAGLTLSAWLGLFMVRRLSPLGQLSDAVRRHQFIVAYQPIVDLTTRRCIGAEALVRWKHQNRIVRPDPGAAHTRACSREDRTAANPDRGDRALFSRRRCREGSDPGVPRCRASGVYR